MIRRARFTALATVPVAFLLAACSGSSGGAGEPSPTETDAAGATASCDGLLLPAQADAALPSGIPAPDGATFYQVEAQGQTQIHFAYVKGDDVVAERDAIKDQLTQAGFTINGQDQEDNTEADLDADSSAHGGTVQVIHLCKDYLRVRYTLDH